MPLQETSGSASYDAFGGGAAERVFIEDVFSTYLVKPASSNTTYSVTNGIDLSGKGGMVWMKARDAAGNNLVYDTARGASSVANNALITNSTSAQQTANFDYITGLVNGFTVNFATGGGQLTNNGINYASWTFRKQAKFFDVVTYTGNGSNRTISHNLGSVPGCIIVKRTDTTANWQVYHRSIANTEYLVLNSTAAKATGATRWNSTTPTSTVFSLGTDTTVNANGGTYVAYLFAHDAGGFGLSGTDNVISCGSCTDNGSAVNLGWEPQFLLVKRTDSSTLGGWFLVDTMRGWDYGSPTANHLEAQSSAAESNGVVLGKPTATGFTASFGTGGGSFIYIAIRRGPMKVPTSGTSVYQPLTGQPNGSGLFAHNILTDFSFYHFAAGTQNWGVQDRLRGKPDLSFNTTAAENGLIGDNKWDVMTGYINPNPGSGAYDSWAFRRAPGFMDVVCWTGVAGTAQQISHNLAAVPELIITKRRDAVSGWPIYNKTITATNYLILQDGRASAAGSTFWNNTEPTSSVFTAGQAVSPTGGTIVAYLFATVAGVSKVGSYTGSGTTKQIDCGFTAGARFVLIKRTDSTGDWYVWDSARGIVAGNDPYALLNSGAANVTSTDYVDTYSAGFELSSTAPAALNANGGSFIFLAIA